MTFFDDYLKERSEYFMRCYVSLVFAYILSELIRYPFNINKVQPIPSFYVHLRYLAFIPLYPFGFAAETGLYMEWIGRLLKYGEIFEINMPNPWN